MPIFRQSLTHITNYAGRLQDWEYHLIFQNELSSGDFVNFNNESRGRFGEDFGDGLPARHREFIIKFTRLLKP
jgi:hypothetical protein